MYKSHEIIQLLPRLGTLAEAANSLSLSLSLSLDECEYSWGLKKGKIANVSTEDHKNIFLGPQFGQIR